MTTPGKPWIQVDAQRLNPTASFALMRARPQAFGIVIAEVLGWGAISLESYQEIIMGNLSSASQAVTFSDPIPFSVDAVAGIQFTAEARIGTLELHYEYWIGEHNGYAYQIVCWGSDKDVAGTKELAEKMYEGFRLLDAEKIASGPAGGGEPFGDYSSAASGFELNLEGTKWAQWPAEELAVDFPEGELGAVFGQAGALVVVPLFHKDLPLTREEIRKELAGLTPWTENVTFEALSDTVDQAVFSESVSGSTFDYTLQIHYAADRSFMISAWGMSELESLKEPVATAIAGFGVKDPLPAAMPESLSEPCRANMASIINRFGVTRYSANKLEQALACFNAAISLHDGPNFVTNILSTLSDLERYEEGLAVVAAQEKPLGEVLLSWKGWFEWNLDRKSQATETYKALFERFPKYKNVEDADFYANALQQTDKLGEAVSFMRDYLKRDDSFDALDSCVDLLIGADKASDAVALLAERLPGREDRLEFAVQQVRAMVEADMAQGAISGADAALADDAENAALLYFKASAESQLRWFRRAKETLEAAIKLAPNDRSIRSMYDSVSGMLGTGDTVLLRTDIAPVAIPESVQKMLDAARV